MEIIIRPIKKNDHPQLINLFCLVPPTVARLKGKSVFNAIIKDALLLKNVTIWLVLIEEQIVGYCIVAWNWKKFKKMFIIRHPLLAMNILYKRFTKKRRMGENQILTVSNTQLDSASLKGDKKFSYNHSKKNIGKIISIGIDPKERKKGLGGKLLKQLEIQYLKDGFERLDAHIGKNNTASVNMFRKAGWIIQEDKTGFFAFMELNKKL